MQELVYIGVGLRKAKTLYERRAKKFIPVGRDDIVTSYPPGDYLVRIRKNSRTMSCKNKRLTVDYAKVEIAMDEARDAMASALMKASELEPTVAPMCKKEVKAWADLRKALGVETLTLTRKAAVYVAEESVRCLRKKLREPAPEGCADVFAERDLGS